MGTLSGTFPEMVERITVAEGVAADRLNRLLTDLVREAYLEGMEQGANCGNSDELSQEALRVCKFDRPL